MYIITKSLPLFTHSSINPFNRSLSIGSVSLTIGTNPTPDMISLFTSLSKLWRIRHVHIDGLVFRLHYMLTVIILLSFCIINSSKQLLGEPIVCETGRGAIDAKIINTFCYIHYTYTVFDATDQKTSRTDPHLHRSIGADSDRIAPTNHPYYQWVWCVLLLQSICFYLPHWLWKCCEGNKISSLVSSDLNYFDDTAKDQKIALIVRYLTDSRGRHDWFAIKYFACEALALFNAIIQIVANNAFLDERYATYGRDVLVDWWAKSDPKIIGDPMQRVIDAILKMCFVS
ncbi:unnamed protein product [Oppiella nova]|uniref:Innexin n=1 Tax=Oppiella nova TaxID=334625 RepID=A0A7R9M230_9ACAR|nr:unnamed protein product [Oppiella nova]CAG2169264.1 unnamed protein product [Oppiella nova]